MRDLIFLVLPLLYSLTILSNHSYWSLPCLIIIGYISTLTQTDKQPLYTTENLDDNIAILSHIIGRHPSVLSIFKGCNILLTCIAILAVDFKVCILI